MTHCESLNVHIILYSMNIRLSYHFEKCYNDLIIDVTIIQCRFILKSLYCFGNRDGCNEDR